MTSLQPYLPESSALEMVGCDGPDEEIPSLGEFEDSSWKQGRGELPIREVARIVQRDVKRVHEDIGILTDLGLLERTENGGVCCPYTSMHIDMYLKAA